MLRIHNGSQHETLNLLDGSTWEMSTFCENFT